jgi:hypothetical protein
VLFALITACATAPFQPSRTAAQDIPAVAPPINVFLDCQASACDDSYFRTEIAFVNWVRDRTEADVHVLITSEGTGGGGSRYALTFIGLRAFARDTLQVGFATPQTATNTERRDLLGNRIAQGLIHYAANTAGMDRVVVKMRGSGDDDEDGAAPAPGTKDPWNHWVFNVEIGANADGETR